MHDLGGCMYILCMYECPSLNPSLSPSFPPSFPSLPPSFSPSLPLSSSLFLSLIGGVVAMFQMFLADDYELQGLCKGHCPFCRKNIDS